MVLSREEIRRKLLHLFALLMPIAIFYAPRWSWPRLLVPGILFLLFAASIIIEALRFKVPVIQKTVLTFFGSMMRKEEHAIVSGWTWVIGAAFFCAYSFYHRRRCSSTRWYRHRQNKNREKNHGRFYRVFARLRTAFLCSFSIRTWFAEGMGNQPVSREFNMGYLSCYHLV
jgi:hypothetical protein